jgi:ABC-2 type transport system permease protein
MNLRTALTQLGAVFRKEVSQTLRDKRVLGVLVVAPLLQLTLLGFSVNLDIDHVPLAVVDLDRTPESRALAERLVAGDTFDRALTTDRPAEAVEALETGAAGAVLVVPAGYARDRGEGRPVALQALVDGTDSNRAIIAGNALAGFTVRESLGLARAALERHGAPPGGLRVEPRVFYNPTLDSQTYFVPGIAATLLLIVTVIVTAMGLAREKETGTLEQVLVTPISPSVLIVGKILPYAIIGLFDLLLVLTAAMWIFGVPMRGTPLVLFAGGALYLLTTLGVGLLASTVARHQQQAFMSALFFILPAIVMSGFLTPIANMPKPLQILSAFDPVRHFVEILRAVMLRGAGWRDLAPQLVALGGMGVTVLLAAVTAMRARLR